MKKFVMAIFILFCLASVVFAQTTTIEVSTTITNGRWDNWQSIQVIFETNVEDGLVIYQDGEVPDHNCVSHLDTQTWFVATVSVGWNKLTFSATTVGILQGKKTAQYAMRYSLDGIIWSDPNSKVISKPRGGVSP